ncbi:uncharacterized protein LOC117337854 [Pecten maximus]|uniref:uncharacterized protein LOC117337854 n=1 Tax=Pecten maximus TaxID=6579 RepID=UPI00145859BB|nr:uncharacterized protein LOC117337854 [Pecten maximus]
MAATGTKREFEGSVDAREVSKWKKRKCRVDNCCLEMGHIHKIITRNWRKEKALEMRRIFGKDVKINRVAVKNSNATDGYSFSKAYCKITENEDYSFSCLFKKGLGILMDYLWKQETPTNDQDSLVLDTLLHYLVKMENVDTQDPFMTLEGLGETDIAIVLANHLFGKLCTSSHFLIDKRCKGKVKDSCPCTDAGCKISGSFGDTGIGNPSVWHGNFDVIVNNQVIIEALEEDEPNVSESSERTPMEVNMKPVCLSTNQQIIAETIVFSFLQKKRHPEYSQFLFPCIGVNSKEMVVCFYDSENDILLKSSPVPLQTVTGKFDVVTIVVSWLVVNHKFLCDGLPRCLEIETSGFFRQAEEALPIYENDLQFGDIGVSCPKPKHHFSFVNDPSTEQIKENWDRMIGDLFSNKT